MKLTRMAKTGRIKALVATDRLKSDGGSVLRDRNGHPRWRRIIKLGAASGFFLLSLFLALASIGLPFPGKVSANQVGATTIYARDGQTVLYKIRGDKNRTPIAFGDMPACIKQATVAVEDKDFYKHYGLDPRGVARAVLVDIGSRRTAEGGSTITQQLVKNALLSNKQTFTRKAQELVLSLEIEQIYPKDKILELYLNEIPYGQSAYGIQAASKTYFGKDAKDLTLAECATLAALPQAPTYYSPYTTADPNRLKNRSKFVLERMLAEKNIPGGVQVSEADVEAAKAQIDQGMQYAAVGSGDSITAPHFVFYVREQLEKKYGTNIAEKGLNVVTSLDPQKQKVAEDVITNAKNNRFAGYGASNAALTSIDPKTGQIVAMVGSANFFDTDGGGNVNVATAERQPGSALKPLVYLAGFQKGKADNGYPLNPATLLWDVKTDFGGGYAPNNYDRKFRGPVSARDSLQQSLNVPSVKMLDLVSIPSALNLMHSLGITTLNDPDRYGDSLVLGGGEVKLVDLTTAYSVLANQGQAASTEGGKAAPVSILEVKNSKGTVLEKTKTNNSQVVSKPLAYQITDVLKDDQARAPQFGRGSALTLPGREAAAKTGTTESYRDAWTVGYTPQLTTGVWLGNNDNTPMNQVGGSLGAAPIWQSYMEQVLKDQPAQKFEKPDGIKEIKVDKLTGLLPGKGTVGTKSEVFTTENAPTTKSDATGLSACAVGSKTANGLKSERPNQPNWENPVQTYIKSRGVSGGSSSGGENNECGPDVSIVSPSNGESVDGTITIQARATTPENGSGIRDVEFAWDGDSIATDDSAPFTVNYTVKNTSGEHTITAKATDNDGNSKTATITVKVGSGNGSTTISLACSSARVCTATPSDQNVSNVRLVNSDTGDNIPMTGSDTTYTATAPPTWNRVYAAATDQDGNTIKSSSRNLALSADRRLSYYDLSWFI